MANSGIGGNKLDMENGIIRSSRWSAYQRTRNESSAQHLEMFHKKQRVLEKSSITLGGFASVFGGVGKRSQSKQTFEQLFRRINALKLASGTSVIFAFVKRANNPADEPSRTTKGRRILKS